MSRETPVTNVLLGTPEALALYRGQGPLVVNFFHAIVDVVEATERAGGDPIVALRDALVALCRHDAQMREQVLQLTATRVDAPVILPTDARG